MILNKIIPIFIVLLAFNFSQKLNAQSCYELVWNDEFNYTGLPDSSLWTFEEGGHGWGNNELQYYTSDRIENAHVENGYLTIEAREEDYYGREYTSARLITYPNNHSWKYGKIEAKIKLPYGQGIWPAFWMLGNGIFEGTPWPGCGEIDIMEMIGGGEGKDDMIYGTIHYADANNNHAEYGGNYQLSEGIFADNFHVFTLEWTENQLIWFIDGVEYHVASLTPNDLNEFHKNFFILLNIAVGGNWPGNPDATTVFPQKMIIDYVRVYQLNNEPEIIGDTLVNKAQKNIVYKTVESEDFTYNWSVPDGAIINNGQGTHAINVTWGCDTGSVECQLTTTCDEYILNIPVKTEKIEIDGKEKVEFFSEDTKYSIPELNETTYEWELPDDVSFVGESDTNIVFLKWGNKSGNVIVNATNNCGTEYDSLYVDAIQQLPFPDPESKQIIPGTIEATFFDSGGEGISYHDNDPENKGNGLRQDEGVDTEFNDGGENIGWIEPGEWVEYSVDIKDTGLYDIELRIASLNGGGQMEIHFNNEDRTGNISIPGTGSWSSFISIFLEEIQLFDTDKLMKLQFIVGEFNISRLIFSNTATSVSNITSNLSDIIIYPNPAEHILQLRKQKEVFNYRIFNLLGVGIQTGKIMPGDHIDINALQKGTYFLNLYNNEETRILRFIKL